MNTFHNDRYRKSHNLLQRALKVIPLGSQTFSKSHIQFPQGATPLFLAYGKGGRVWDADGNEYVDLICALLPVILGYCDPDVDKAIRSQLEKGISFSLATVLEVELAERLVELIPCAERVRFGKNGTDATSAAIRLARAFTGKDYIIACGYHGWQDWYIGATVRNKGVPEIIRHLTKCIPYNDLDAINKIFSMHKDNVAAVIMEPMNSIEPATGYLEDVKELAHRNGALLVYDEVITGFRYALGGAQQLFGVVPDLAAFGKAMGNGMPISAVVGRADVMREMEEVFYSGTFGGETLSIAAAIAVIDKMRRAPVIDRLWSTGEKIAAGVRDAIVAAGLDKVIALSGKPPWILLGFNNHPAARKEVIKNLVRSRDACTRCTYKCKSQYLLCA
jgi:Glutamate-1-semialdehyde aminotransferase